MSNSRGDENPNSLFKIMYRATTTFGPIRAVTTFATHMLTNRNAYDGIVSAGIAAASAPLTGAMYKLTFFRGYPPDSPIFNFALINTYSFIASQAMFALFKQLFDLTISKSDFTIDATAGLLLLTAFITLAQDLRAQSNLVDGSKSSFIRGLCR